MSVFALGLLETQGRRLGLWAALAAVLAAVAGGFASYAAAEPLLVRASLLSLAAVALLLLAIRLPVPVLPLAVVVGLIGLGNMELSRIVPLPMLGSQEKWVLAMLGGVVLLGVALDVSAPIRPTWPAVLVLGGLFLAVCTGSLFYAADRQLAWDSLAHQAVQMPALAAGFFWIRRAREAGALVACLAAVGAVSAALGLWQFLTPEAFNNLFGRFTDPDMRFFMDYWALDVGRIGALWAHAPPFAAFLSALLPAFLYLWLRHRTLWRAWLAIGGFMLTTVALVLTGTRMEFVGAVAGVVAMFAAWGVSVNSLTRVRAGILPALAGALVVASVLSAQGSPESNVFTRTLRLLQGDPATTDMVSHRKAAYAGLLDAWRSNPILGVGLGNTQEATENATAYTGWRALTSPHSYYLGLLAQTGLAGMGLVALMLAAMIPHYRRLLKRAVGSRERAFGAFALAASVAVLVGGIADNAMLYVWQVGVVFWLLQGAVVSLSLRGEEEPAFVIDQDGASREEARDAG
jgi:hypothetical protein